MTHESNQKQLAEGEIPATLFLSTALIIFRMFHFPFSFFFRMLLKRRHNPDATTNDILKGAISTRDNMLTV